MPHGDSWLSFVPGFHALEHFVEGFGPSWGFGSAVHVQHLASMLLVTLLMLVLTSTARAQLQSSGGSIVPKASLSPQTIVELLLEGLLSLMQFAMPYEAALRHFRVVGTLAGFILFSNLLGLIPGFVPPTESFNTTFACATVVFVYYNAYAFYKLGMGHIAHMANPVGETWGWLLAPLFLPLELISHCIRPASLAVRLMCNINGDHLVMGVFLGMFPFILPMPFLALGLFVAIVQTFVFTLLSCVYIGEVESIVAHHHHDHAHGHGGGDEAAAHSH